MEILPQLILNAIITGSIYALVSAGLTVTFGLLGILNFAHGHLMMLGAYVFFLFNVILGLGLPLSTALTAVACVCSSFLILRVFVMPFRRVNPIVTLVSTLALANIIESLVSLSFGVNVRSLPAGGLASSLEYFGVFVTGMQLLIIACAVCCVAAAALVIHSTGFGRRIRALSEHGVAAQSIGIRQDQTSYLTFAAISLVATLAGVLIGYETNLQPTMGTSYTIKAFAAMILGGLGNLWGTLIGAYILGLVENLAIGLEFGGYSIPSGYKDAFAYGIILITLLFRPHGILGKRVRHI